VWGFGFRSQKIPHAEYHSFGSWGPHAKFHAPFRVTQFLNIFYLFYFILIGPAFGATSIIAVD
jgi:hypothetical protein